MRVGLALVVLVLLLLAALSGCATISAEKNAPPIGRFVEVDGETMHLLEAGVEHKGKAPSILLIHGASINLRDMKMALGDTLSERYHVLMIDRPGRGYSSRPKGGHQLARQAQLIRDASKTLGIENPIVVGQSFGGSVALAYALQYQDEMSGVVLLAPVSHEWQGGVAWYNSVSSTPVLGPLFRWFVIPAYGQIAGPKGVVSSFAPNDAPENYYERVGLPLLFRPKDFKSNASDVANLKAEIIAMQDRYGSLELPMAIMTGDDDTTVSPEIHSKTLAAEVDGASLDIFPETGHALHHVHQGKIIEAIDRIAN